MPLFIKSMSHPPLLQQFYARYLRDEKSADFVAAVSEVYTMATLEKLAIGGDRISRRAAVMAVGFLGDFTHNRVLGSALRDDDRAVRLLADHGIRQIWFRVPNAYHEQRLILIHHLNQSREFARALDECDLLLEQDRSIAEAWNQRAVANYALDQFGESCADCWNTLQLNPFHFSAALGLGHSHLQLQQVGKALDGFEVALEINPDLENVRAQIRHLQRLLDQQ